MIEIESGNDNATGNQEKTIFVRTFGSFSLVSSFPSQRSEEGVEIDIKGRARRIWLLIIYLLINRDRFVPTTELIDVLWSGDEQRDDPLRTLQHNVSRARDLLAASDLPDARNLIISRPGSYRWNPQRSTAIDIDVFKRLVDAARYSEDRDERIALHRQAIAIYRGDFLPGFESHSWVASTSAFARSAYVNECIELTNLLSMKSDAREISLVCENAIRFAPESEELHARYMRALTSMGHPEKAISVYDGFKSYLASYLDVDPGEEVSAAREEANMALRGEMIAIEGVKAMLDEKREEESKYRDFMSFSYLVRLEARNDEVPGRQSIVVSLGFDGSDCADRMELLEDAVVSGLRDCDMYTRISSRQILAFLPDVEDGEAPKFVGRLKQVFEDDRSEDDSRFVCDWYRVR